MPATSDPKGPAAPGDLLALLERFGLHLAKLHGGSNNGAYVAVPGGLAELSMTVLDPVGEQLDLYDVYGCEDDATLEGEIEVQVYQWQYTLRGGVATALWPLLLPPRGDAGPHWPRRPEHRSVPFFLTREFERDLYQLTRATGMTREELVESAVFELADTSDLLDVVSGDWARRRLRAARGAEPVVGREQLAPWYLGTGTRVVVAGELATAACWVGFPPVTVSVGSPCAGPPSGGMWTCVSHNRRLPHSGDVDRHVDGNEDHVLGWLCPAHELEAPETI